MQAIRIKPAPETETPYSPTNPAPSKCLTNDKIPIPRPKSPTDLLIKIKATTIIRDMLTWPEYYHQQYTIPGHDFSGTVAAVFESDSSTSSSPSPPHNFIIGDEVFGMANTNRASTWAEYAIVSVDEVARKPRTLGWEEAAALPLSALTAYEALFRHAGIPVPIVGSGKERNVSSKRVLITGASGGVGIYLVQLAASAGVHVVAASSSNVRNGEFLRGLGAGEVVEYGDLEGVNGAFDVIVDCVGGEVLSKCWGFVKGDGVLISVDSASFDFVAEHQKRGLCDGKEGVKALFFIVEGDGEVLSALAALAESGALRSFVAATFPIESVREAYDFANGRFEGRGKVVLTV
ncbi:hypothetical protein N7522_008466 [Penicillium canescens]|uniref:Enoyl reductase (ER) domain-containing protein n=1 Tax=Penicillium canescens TaxID=5083 RepID=A0AAD6IED6_PENCN|nr:uncharacterized protein N7446_002568 [Penicillium canescens]KAJ5996806.1 hypothetical protein N7522_008466 [Penicillium canescens]KAJ6044375.1 hypothetical protein N7460_005730 [Penicillium canescens]KAJ6055843.1 hypothetical protein N7444_004941 [Penicillium canescens]KAJ6074791.1 hypothetical protein N7446_002568 [Penicillium canescens]